EAERAFAMMVQAVTDYAIFKLDANGRVRTWNQGAEQINGYKAQEIIGKDFSIFYTEEARNISHPQFELKEAVKNGSYEEEGWRVRKDGSVFWASVTITHVPDGFLKVTRDLTERKRHETQLEEARNQALAANRLKSQFVANVTHEIRTPLTSIVGLSELLMEETRDNGELGTSARTIFESSRLLLGLLNDLLDFAKLESGKMVIESTPFSVSRLVEDVVGLNKARAEQKGLSFISSFAPDVPALVKGDPAKVRQILLNLVHNAIKFTDAGGIELSVSMKDQHIYFAVTDTGIGISKEKQDKLFHPFSQAHDSTARDYGGTGLGLSIAQQYAQLLQGEIGVLSEAGQGSTFWFAVPLTLRSAEAIDA
ncbi:MAG TPA: ATP-binding protein, partial [Chroococcales cyanobacterium]